MKKYAAWILLPVTLISCQTGIYQDPARLATPFADTIVYPHGMPLEGEIALGRQLFFDIRLSPQGKTSCASCHDPAKGFSNGTVPGPGLRNPPHLYNLAWTPLFYWDGRTATLEKQALELANPSVESVLNRLRTVPNYLDQFAKIYPGKGLSEETLSRALASFERSLISNASPFDQFMSGQKAAMSAGAVRGLALFQGKAFCHHCHSGPNFTDNEFHNTGVITDDAGFHREDRQGPRELSFTPYPFFATHHAFKTPGLRNVAVTAPYFHNGSLRTLEEVVNFYDRGGDKPGSKGLARHIQPLGLSSQEKKDLVEFMQNLTNLVGP
jgi:cytochrome c peroxidase